VLDPADEASKCMFCGFCEQACPTLRYGRHRGYGPRGRVWIARRILEGARVSPGALESFFSCLLCGACTLYCPSGIDVAGLVRSIRSRVVGVF